MQSLKKFTWEHCLWDIPVIIWCGIMEMHIWNLKYFIPVIDCDADIMTLWADNASEMYQTFVWSFDVLGLGDGWVITVLSSLFFQFAKKGRGEKEDNEIVTW